MHINVDFELFNEGTDSRVLVFTVPPRPIGLPVQVDGVAWWREGDSLVPMPEDVRLKIYEESGRDFSAEVCAGAKWTDLDPAAIESFRKTWIEKHMQNEGNRGLHLNEFAQVLPSFSDRKIQRLLNALAGKGQAKVIGKTKGAKWYLIDSN